MRIVSVRLASLPSDDSGGCVIESNRITFDCLLFWMLADWIEVVFTFDDNWEWHSEALGATSFSERFTFQDAIALIDFRPHLNTNQSAASGKVGIWRRVHFQLMSSYKHRVCWTANLTRRFSWVPSDISVANGPTSLFCMSWLPWPRGIGFMIWTTSAAPISPMASCPWLTLLSDQTPSTTRPSTLAANANPVSVSAQVCANSCAEPSKKSISPVSPFKFSLISAYF